MKVFDIEEFVYALDNEQLEMTQLCNDITRYFGDNGYLAIRCGERVHSTVQDAVGVVDQFFSQPLEDKKLCTSKSKSTRGFCDCNNENFASLVGEKKPNDLVEKFRIGPEIDHSVALTEYYSTKEGRVYFFPNTWPDKVANFELSIRSYYETVLKLGMAILRVLEIGLNLPRDFFSSKMNKQTSILGLNYFPELSPSYLSSVSLNESDVERCRIDGPTGPIVRIADHTDVSMLTIISQFSHKLLHDQDARLEIYSPGQQTWTSVPYLPDTFVVNIGDCLQDWTHNRLVSTRHRVVMNHYPSHSSNEMNLETPCRYSMAFFLSPNYDAIMDWPIITDEVSSSNKPLLLTYSQWRRKRIQSTLSILRSQK